MTAEFAFLPCGGDELASARIRVQGLRRGLHALGVETALGPVPEAKTLVVQKRWDWASLSAARGARRAGRRVFFDLDDAVDTDNPNFLEMIRLADAVLTDTAGHRDWMSRRYAPAHVEIVPDGVDYHPEAPTSPSVTGSALLRVLWFGSFDNLALVEKYLPALAAATALQVVVSTDARRIEGLRRRYPAVEFAPWSTGGFVETLRSCDISFLMHDGSETDRMKSNNKMIASIAWGVPAAVSRTPEYERTAREAGIEAALFSGPEELRGVIEGLRAPEARERYLREAQPEIWRRYCPQAVARIFLERTAAIGSRLPGGEAVNAAANVIPEWRARCRDVAGWGRWKARSLLAVQQGARGMKGEVS